MMARMQASVSQSVVVCALALLALVPGSPAKQPNLLVIVADDLGFADLGYTGSGIKTPHLDGMAKGGLILDHYYVNLCCTPTRSMLQTGRFNIRYGLQTGVIPNTQAYGLNLTETLVSQHMQSLGYATHAVGKWHLGIFQEEYTPTFRGYDSFFGYYGGSEDYYKHTNSGIDLHLDVGANCGRNCSQAMLNDTGTYSTYLYADRVKTIVEAHDVSKPLFMYMAFQSVHCPIQVPPEYVTPYAHLDPNRQQFAGMVAALDEAVGNITAVYQQKGLWDDTFVVFTTDNGGPVGSKNEHPAGIGCATGAQNYPLRGGKGAYFQGGVRGTGFVYGPQLHPSLRGARTRDLIHVVDWLPTLVDAASEGTALAAPQSAHPLDGVSHWPLFTKAQGGARQHALINIERAEPTTAACQGPTCQTHPQCNGVGQYVVVSGQHKIILGGGGQPNTWYHDGLPYNGTAPTPQGGCIVACTAPSPDGCPETPYVQVFDLFADEGEHHNLAPSSPELVASLMEVVKAYNSSHYVPALTRRLPKETSCPFNDARGVVTPCTREEAEAAAARRPAYPPPHGRVTVEGVWE